MKGTIESISGPVVKAKGLNAKINDIVRVGKEKLLGEVIEIRKDVYVIQVYEETDGLGPGEPVENTNRPLSVALGPGLLGSVYDGIQRPLPELIRKSGSFISRGLDADALDQKKKWKFTPKVKKGDTVQEGHILGEVKETSMIVHKILVPPGISGKVTSISSGEYTVTQEIAKIDKHSITMQQFWPVRKARKYGMKIAAGEPLVTGQRIYDFFFPAVKGGQCAVPGPFGSGKTVTQQAIAKWCDAEIIVYIGCGERGNEMTEVLTEFPHLKDPKTGKPLMDRTVLVANTSNMPVAAREASVYTGITIAEYFRDMGYNVALMADSTSRWAEAMREISGRLEEMPGEEGYPAYLANKLAQFYERAGRVETLGGKKGSITLIGAVSPPGGDFSEPVTQNTLKIVKVFWALDAKLAAKRHYWAIDWLKSYSLYTDLTNEWFDKNVAPEWSHYRAQAMELLQKEAGLLEIAQLVGKDSMPQEEQFTLLAARLVREDVLQQNAFDAIDMYNPLLKQFWLVKNIIDFYQWGVPAVQAEKMTTVDIEGSDAVELIGQMKNVPNEGFEKELKKVNDTLKKFFGGAK